MVRLSMDSRHFGRWPEIGKTDSRASDLRLHEQQPGMNGHSLDRRFTNYGFCPLRRIAPLFSAWKAGCDPTGSGRNLQPGREIRQRSTAGFDPGLKVGRERHRPSRLPYPTYRSPRGRCTFRPDPLRRPPQGRPRNTRKTRTRPGNHEWTPRDTNERAPESVLGGATMDGHGLTRMRRSPLAGAFGRSDLNLSFQLQPAYVNAP